MTLRYHRLKSPSFDLSWCDLGEKDHVLLLAGGGGSTKSGVKNQIQIARVFDADKVEMMDSYITDDDAKSRLCCGVTHGQLKNIPVVCALLDSDCLILTLEHSVEGAIRLTKKVEFGADFAKEESAVNCSYIANSGHVITGGQDSIVRVWVIDISFPPKEKGREAPLPWKAIKKAELRAHTGPVMALSAHPSRNWLCSASKDGSCKVWDLDNKRLLCDVPCCVDGLSGMGSTAASSAAPSFQCRGCSFSTCGDFLYSVQSGRRGASHVIKWQLKVDEEDVSSSTKEGSKDGEKKLSLRVLPSRVAQVCKVPCTTLSLSADGAFLAVGGSDGSVAVLRSKGLAKVLSRACHDLPVTGLGFASTGVCASLGVEAMTLSCSADRALAAIKIGGYSKVFKILLVVVLLLIVTLMMLYSSAVWLVIADSIAGPLR